MERVCVFAIGRGALTFPGMAKQSKSKDGALPEKVASFVESWGSQGVVWGVNRSMARIHALFLVSEEPLGLDRISQLLDISRGNASMCLKELRNWGVIQRIHKSGDRQDYYVAEPDSWTTLLRIATERKRREFDPALGSLRHLLAEEDFSGAPKTLKRLEDFEQLFTSLDTVVQQMLAHGKAGSRILQILQKILPKS